MRPDGPGAVGIGRPEGKAHALLHVPCIPPGFTVTGRRSPAPRKTSHRIGRATENVPLVEMGMDIDKKRRSQPPSSIKNRTPSDVRAL